MLRSSDFLVVMRGAAGAACNVALGATPCCTPSFGGLAKTRPCAAARSIVPSETSADRVMIAQAAFATGRLLLRACSVRFFRCGDNLKGLSTSLIPYGGAAEQQPLVAPRAALGLSARTSIAVGSLAARLVENIPA